MKPSVHFVLITIVLFVLFSWDLTHFHSTIRGHPMLIGGIHPYSDAHGYLEEALRFNQTGWLEALGSRRPIPILVLAGLTRILGMNLIALQFTVAFTGALACAIVFFTAMSLLPLPLAGGALLVVAMFFLSEAQGTLMTEYLGLLIAAIALFYLVTGIKRENASYTYAGLFGLSLALAVRPGPLLVLPLLALLAARFIPGQKHWLRKIAFSSFILALPFLISITATKFLSSTPQIPFSNFSSVAFGIANGGTGWISAYTTYPHLLNESESEQTRFILSKTTESVQEDPYKLLLGIYRQFEKGLLQAQILSFVPTLPARLLLILGLLLSIVHGLRRNTKPVEAVLALIAIGTILSIPVSLDGGPRVIAAVVPVLAIACYIPLRAIIPYRGRIVSLTAPVNLIAVILTVILLIGAYPIVNVRTPANIACAGNEGSPEMTIDKSELGYGQVTVIDNNNQIPDELAKSGIITMNQEQWLSTIGSNWFDQEFLNELRNVKPGSFVASYFDNCSNKLVWLIGESYQLHESYPLKLEFLCDKIYGRICAADLGRAD